jgi:micrococcal nuclease
VKNNNPLHVLIVSTIAFVTIIIGSLPEIQLSISNLLGLSDKNSIFSVDKKGNTIARNTETVRVNRVIDGDTILLSDGRTIRYLDMDTPETKKANTPVMCFGPEASSYNKFLVEGKEIVMVPDKEKTDQYGRELRFIYLAGKDTTNIQQSVNAQLVQKGFARSRIFKPNNTYEKEFNDLEYKAQKEKLGVWSCPKPFEE